MKRFSILLLSLLMFQFAKSQDSGLIFSSSDSSMVRTFNWAKTQALAYKGNSNDAVGPWYEAALPSRNAFCMRDVSHQSVGAEILGLGKENRNMFRKFAEGISESKKWCSFWEINNEGKPAPADYASDNDFWYNLDANFDVIYALWRLYNWTGDESYISDPLFVNFIEKSMNEYVTMWKLDADSLFIRPKNLNADPVLLKKFRRGYGLSSYAESVPGLAMSTDLVAALYQGYTVWSEILKIQNRNDASLAASQKAGKYSDQLIEKWWDKPADLFNTYCTYDGKFGKGEGEAFLLWFDILKDSTMTRCTINNLVSRSWNVENTSYFPALLYKSGYWNKAYEYLLFCSDSLTKRREYPEVSYGVIEGIVRGLMGIEAEAQGRKLSTLCRSTGSDFYEIANLPVLNTFITLKHVDNKKSVIINNGGQSFVWKAEFSGIFSKAKAGKKTITMKQSTGKDGKTCSFVEVPVNPGQKIEVSVK